MSDVLKSIAATAKAFPDRVVYTTANAAADGYALEQITWQELEERSNAFAAWLKKHQSGNTPVLVYGHKSPCMLVLFTGCVKAGCAYVPVDSSTPLGRIHDIARAVGCQTLLLTEDVAGLDVDARVLRRADIKAAIEENAGCPSDPSSWVKGDDVYYIIFTSGSTGTPKGVQITADCLDNFLKWSSGLACPEPLEKGSFKVFVNQAPFSFDLSVFDLYTALYTGGSIWAIPKKFQEDMGTLSGFLAKSGAHVWVSTPSFVEMMLADASFASRNLPNLSTFLFCGEMFIGRTAEKLQAAFPKARIVNTYGPTESTVAVTSIAVTPELARSCTVLPLGAPKPGTSIYIMDEAGAVLPDGEKGEIVIVGDTVSIGYWRNPEKNKEMFGVWTSNGKTERLYHTHDAGYAKDGIFFYCGRMDKQIKLHGYRIEIEDIENNILSCERVDRVAVIPEYTDEKVSGLIAYVVPRGTVESTLKERQAIRKALKERIPDYMIPKKFVFKDSLPMTANGKVDRRALENL